MGKYTVSVSKGPVARRHDQRTREDVERAHKAKRPYYTNCDPERTAKNVILVGCEDTQVAFDAVFADAVDEYNAKQKRKDRRIDSYWRKCQADQKMHEPILEYVFQVGDKDNHPDDDEAIEILTDAFERWQADNPNMHVLWATIHMDEATPHMHVCFAGASKGRKNGLSLKAGMDAAMREQGFRSTKQTPSVKSQWQEAQMDALADVLEHHGHTRVKGKGDKRKHEPVDVFKQNEQLREEQARLEREVTELAVKAQKARVDIARAEAVAAELDERERSVRIRERDADEREGKLQVRENALDSREVVLQGRQVALEDATEQAEKARKQANIARKKAVQAKRDFDAALEDLRYVDKDVDVAQVVQATFDEVDARTRMQDVPSYLTITPKKERPYGMWGKLTGLWQEFTSWLKSTTTISGQTFFDSIVEGVKIRVSPYENARRMTSVQQASRYEIVRGKSNDREYGA